MRAELKWRIDFTCIFSPLSIAVYEWAECMWRMSKVDVENEQAERSGLRFLLVLEKQFLKCTLSFCFVLMIM